MSVEAWEVVGELYCAMGLASHISSACDHDAIASLQTRLDGEMLLDVGGRDIPKRSTRPLRLALVRARPMCVPGLRPPAVSWIHACESQTRDCPMIVLIANLVLDRTLVAD